jgi:WD40 repeat protein
MLTASANHIARVWNVETGEVLAVLEGQLSDCKTAVFSPDGRQILTVGDTIARLWNSATGKSIKAFTKETSILGAAFDRDVRSILMIIGRPPYVYLWDIESAKAVELSGHEDAVATAAFGPDGRRIVTASNDGTVRLWDAQTGGAIDELRAHKKRVLYAIFSPDGQQFVTTSTDQTARLWRTFVSTQEMINFAKMDIHRCLTPAQRSQKFGLGDISPSWCERMHKWPFVRD